MSCVPTCWKSRNPVTVVAAREAFGALDEQLLLALEQGDAEVVSGLLATMYLNGVSAAEICDGPLRHAMHRIGERWPEDPKGIFLEHRATNICMDALNRLRANFPSAATKAAAIGGAPEHDPYLLPSLMATYRAGGCRIAAR